MASGPRPQRARHHLRAPRLPLKGSFKGDIDMGIGVDIDMDIDSDMAVSINSGSFDREL